MENTRRGWFGENWGAPVCFEEDHIPIPIGQTCLHCGEKFTEGDQGLTDMAGNAMHIECDLRAVLGGANHIRETCACFGGTDDPDPPGVTKREAAKLAVIEWEKKIGISRS